MLRSRKPHLYIYDMHSIYRYTQLASDLIEFVEEISGARAFHVQRPGKIAEARLNERGLLNELISYAEQGVRLEFFSSRLKKLAPGRHLKQPPFPTIR